MQLSIYAVKSDELVTFELCAVHLRRLITYNMYTHYAGCSSQHLHTFYAHTYVIEMRARKHLLDVCFYNM